MDSFEQYVRGGLTGLSVAVDDSELQIMRFAELVYGAERDALLTADLAEIEPEFDLDPSRAPR